MPRQTPSWAPRHPKGEPRCLHTPALHALTLRTFQAALSTPTLHLFASSSHTLVLPLSPLLCNTVEENPADKFPLHLDVPSSSEMEEDSF